MDRIRISDDISYIEAMDDPLSADIGIVKGEDCTWLFDVGNGERPISDLDGHFNVVLSHFHPDHIGNIGKIHFDNLYVSKETFRHMPDELKTLPGIHILREPVTIGNVRVFPFPSSHAKGSLAMEVDGEYTFVGDGLYARSCKDGYYFNIQFLKEEIEMLEKISSKYLLFSHLKGMVRNKAEVIEELKAMYGNRKHGCNEIPVGR